ncbi:MAG TPA: efflux RND transporter periplasmic adaptor subunit, partial [Gemmatimonadales bacterium]|nr:efflux RND transporter periplasmic adaptor subunit [Gemmatimonadales bacterium]
MRMRLHGRGWLLAGLGIGALGGAAAGCRSGSDAARAEETAAPTVTLGPENVAVVETMTLRSGPNISGTLDPERKAVLRAEVAGAIVELRAEAGQPVRRGTVLARIDETALQDAFLSARAAVRSAETALQVARRNAERSEALAAAGAIAERDLEQARWNAMSAEAALADAQARLAAAGKQLGKTTLRAPFDGVVSEARASLGDVVQPGAELFTVVDPSSMELAATVPADRLAELTPGTAVEFTVSGFPGRSFTGRVQRINPAVDPATRQVRIYATIPNAGRALVAGLFAEGRVATV